jgi:hypothetical protein
MSALPHIRPLRTRMLKTVSSITNAIGALNYKGTWNASTNTPTLASGVGTKGDYYVVSVAGSTTLDGISNWGVGDWAAFNGSVWQRVEGGANLNGVDLSVSGTTTLSGLTASTALALNASKEIVSVTNTGTGNNVLATAPTLVGDVSLSTGNLVIGTAGKGIDFSATAGTGTSELLADYEEGTWTPALVSTAATFTYPRGQSGKYVKVGRLVTASFYIGADAAGTTSNSCTISGLPFTTDGTAQSSAFAWVSAATPIGFTTDSSATTVTIWKQNSGTVTATALEVAGGYLVGSFVYISA